MPRTAATPVPLCVAELDDGKQCRQPIDAHYIEDAKGKRKLRKRPRSLAHEPRLQPMMMGRKRMREIIKRQEGLPGASQPGASHGRTGTPQWLTEVASPAFVKPESEPYVVVPIRLGQRISAFLRQRGIDPNKSAPRHLTPKQRRRVMHKARKAGLDDDGR